MGELVLHAVSKELRGLKDFSAINTPQVSCCSCFIVTQVWLGLYYKAHKPALHMHQVMQQNTIQ